MPLPSDEQLATMGHGDLLLLRGKMAKDKAAQEKLAPYEHRAFAREYVSNNPVTGALGVGAAIPAYQAAKTMGIGTDETTTPPSFEQMKQGYIGIVEGLMAKKRLLQQ